MHESFNKSNFLHFIMVSVCVALVFLIQIYRVSGMECGTVNIVRPRILGGNQALRGEWPFVASIQNQSKYICGGTIISNKHILTGNDEFSSCSFLK